MDGLYDGQIFDAVRKKEGLQAVKQMCELSRNPHSHVQVCMSAKCWNVRLFKMNC